LSVENGKNAFEKKQVEKLRNFSRFVVEERRKKTQM
jgi:hypothetical protein